MADQRGGDIIQKWARRLGLGHPTGIDLPGEGAGLVPTPEWRNRLFRRNLTDRPWTPGRQHQPRRRAGRPAGRPAPDGRRLQRDRQRRAHRDPAHRDAGRGQRRAHPAADRARRAAPHRHLLLDPRGDHAGPARGRERPGRHVRPPCSTASRSRSPARPARPSAARRATSPGTSPWRPPTTRASWSRSTIERGGFGAEAAAPATRRILAAYFGIKGKKAVGAAGSSPD